MLEIHSNVKRQTIMLERHTIMFRDALQCYEIHPNVKRHNKMLENYAKVFREIRHNVRRAP